MDWKERYERSAHGIKRILNNAQRAIPGMGMIIQIKREDQRRVLIKHTENSIALFMKKRVECRLNQRGVRDPVTVELDLFV